MPRTRKRERLCYHTINTLAASTSVVGQTLRNYVARGLLIPDAETADGRPLFECDSAVARVEELITASPSA